MFSVPWMLASLLHAYCCGLKPILSRTASGRRSSSRLCSASMRRASGRRSSSRLCSASTRNISASCASMRAKRSVFSCGSQSCGARTPSDGVRTLGGGVQSPTGGVRFPNGAREMRPRCESAMPWPLQAAHGRSVLRLFLPMLSPVIWRHGKGTMQC